MRRVEGWGNKRARLVILGEAPGECEENVGQPFVGRAGFRLNEWMARVGLSRTDAFIDNVYQYRPPGNVIKAIDRITLEQWMGYLHERIAELDDPWVIVPTGNYALYALTGKGKVHWHMRDGRESRPGILDWRGSILEYTDLRGRRIKCIPTIHPAATFRQPTLERACVVDWERIAAELSFREIRRPVRTHHIYPSLSQLASLHQSACQPGAVLAIDIENPRTEKSEQILSEDGTPARYKSGKNKGRVKTHKVKGDPAIVCVGFAFTPTESITVPTTLSYWKTEDRLAEAWTWVHHLCTSPAEKVLHNGLYDTFFLADHGIKLANWKWDTLYMHHCLDASAPHDLAYCASVDTREPYWKCLGPGTRVLKADLTWEKVENLKVGDVLVGCEEHLPRKKGKRHFQPSTVLECGARQEKCCRITFENGLSILASREHPWLGQKYTNGTSRGTLQWIQTQHLKPGMPISYLCEPWKTDTSYVGGWLAGLYDGEGNYGPNTLSFCQNPGTVLSLDKELLTQKGFQWRNYKKSEVGRVERVTLTTTVEAMRFLGSIRPVRFMPTSQRVWNGKRIDSYRFPKLKVRSVEEVGEQQVIGLMTSTKTFIAEGLWTHNSEAKDPDEIGKYTSNWAAFLTYNGKDCCVTRELYDIYKSRLGALQLNGETGLDFYLRHYITLLEPLLDLERHGFRVDAHKRKYRLMELLANCVGVQDRLTALSGTQLYATTALSTTRLKKYLYDQLALPKQWRKRKDTGEKTETVDEVAVRRLMERHPTCQPLQATGPLILSHRRQQTLLNFYKTERIDEDGRYRSSYSPNTEAGRLSSSKNPRGTGSNAQNVDREARDIFLADAGMVGVEVDASQAEARIDYLLIYMLTKDRSILDKARLRPDEYDQHTETAAAIFGKPAIDITKEERYLGKKAVHAAFRDMQGQKLADELLKDGHVYTAEACDKLIKAFRNRLGVGYIEELFRWVRGRIIQDRYLENSWGRRLWFEYDRLDDEAYRRGYSFDPQSEVADLINQRGLILLHSYLAGTPGHINAHVHDSLFFSVPREIAYDTTKFLVDSLEQPRTYWGVELVMPCEIKVGGRWKCEHEWKRMPSRAEFESVTATISLVP